MHVRIVFSHTNPPNTTMIRVTPLHPHPITARNEQVKRLFTPAELQAHARAIDALVRRLEIISTNQR